MRWNPIHWMRVRRLRRRQRAAQVDRAARHEGLATSRLYDQCWAAYDNLPSGPAKRRAAAALCFCRHETGAYRAILTLLKKEVARAVST